MFIFFSLKFLKKTINKELQKFKTISLSLAMEV